MESHIKFLLNYCRDKAELYNKVASRLWVEFGISQAEISLLCTFIASEVLLDEYRKGNKRTDKKVGGSKT